MCVVRESCVYVVSGVCGGGCMVSWGGQLWCQVVSGGRVCACVVVGWWGMVSRGMLCLCDVRGTLCVWCCREVVSVVL